MQSKPFLKCTGGFTLVELMIVVAIISVLAAIAIPQYQFFVMKAKRIEAINLMRALATAELAYAAANETYPHGPSNPLSSFSTMLGFDVPTLKYYVEQPPYLYTCDVICPAVVPPTPCDSFNVVLTGDLDNNQNEAIKFDVIFYQHSGDAPGGSALCPPMVPTAALDTPWVLFSDF